MNLLSLLLPSLLLLSVCNGEGGPPRGTRRGVRRLVRRPGAGAGAGTGRVKRRKKVGWWRTKLILTPKKKVGGKTLFWQQTTKSQTYQTLLQVGRRKPHEIAQVDEKEETAETRFLNPFSLFNVVGRQQFHCYHQHHDCFKNMIFL